MSRPTCWLESNQNAHQQHFRKCEGLAEEGGIFFLSRQTGARSIYLYFTSYSCWSASCCATDDVRKQTSDKRTVRIFYILETCFFLNLKPIIYYRSSRKLYLLLTRLHKLNYICEENITIAFAKSVHVVRHLRDEMN